ncbi:LysM peptidoglycan-binding domain-containing protein [Geosporobacter ferrireducens]|uniref:LysM peptidoglycan-binding domain-containing protein n=1 Tax=Geosporobacter ferrireducens TaxID=1424294 RepID=UPI0009F5C2DB|nr:LysM peptidoglycan-binding domain-containing protein [Geosporobacter ferrireducens]MTI58118.1 LysM peptidoglycan-binding domain-containing protein [Geosporobacter ferrireducens]
MVQTLQLLVQKEITVIISCKLYSIALRLGVSFDNLVRENVGVDNVDVIYAGQPLIIP